MFIDYFSSKIKKKQKRNNKQYSLRKLKAKHQKHDQIYVEL